MAFEALSVRMYEGIKLYFSLAVKGCCRLVFPWKGWYKTSALDTYCDPSANARTEHEWIRENLRIVDSALLLQGIQSWYMICYTVTIKFVCASRLTSPAQQHGKILEVDSKPLIWGHWRRQHSFWTTMYMPMLWHGPKRIIGSSSHQPTIKSAHVSSAYRLAMFYSQFMEGSQRRSPIKTAIRCPCAPSEQ